MYKCPPQVIYVARNPKDVLVSYYHFHKVAVMMETPKDFNEFFDKFMEGRGKCIKLFLKTNVKLFI